MSVRLVVADDHAVIRAGLSALLAGSEIKIVGEASGGAEAVKMAVKCKPDLVLLDVRMPDYDGFKALEKIRCELPDTRVIMFSDYDNPTYVARAVALGASDYVLKGTGRQQLISIITAVAAGKSPSDAGELQRVAVAMRDTNSTNTSDKISLTNRETQVLRHVALGLSNKEIGLSLKISIETVKEHVQTMMRKLSVKDRTRAAVWAVGKGFV